MAYKIMQKDNDGVMREVIIRGQAVHGTEIGPGDIELKEFDDTTRSFIAVGSTGNPDRIEDVVDQRGWELENFLKNPVGMWAHKYDMLPIFRVADIEIKPRSKKFIFKPEFDDYEFADNVYRSYKRKFMKGFSVGFIPIEYELRNREEMTEDEKMKAGWMGGRHFKRQELLEMSAAPIPMNPEALAGIKSLGIPTEWDTGISTNLGPNKATLSDGSTWVPIDDISFFSNVSVVQLEDVKVVNGKALGEIDEGIISKVVGYIFPKEMGDEEIAEWFVKRNVSEDKVEAYLYGSGSYIELSVDDGKFTMEVRGKEPDVEEVETPEIPHAEVEIPQASSVTDSEDNNDHVESTVDNVGEGFDIIPESVEVQDGELLVKLNLGSFKIDKDMLEGAGLKVEEGKLITTSNRRTLEEACNVLAELLKTSDLEVNIEPEPEQAQEAQNVEEGEDFAVLLTAAEELKADKDAEIEVDLETFRDVLSGVLKEELGDLVKSSVSKNLKQLTGDLE